MLEREHDEALQRDTENFQAKLAQYKQLNSVLSQKLEQAQKAHSDLGLAQDEIVQLKDEQVKLTMENEDLSHKCYDLEQSNIQLQAQAKKSRTEIVENYESERTLTEDKLINY